jgi:hypothetical protein
MKHTCATGTSSCELCKQLEVEVWEAINGYAITVGGDPSKHVYGNVARMQAVADVDKIVAQSRELTIEVSRLRAALNDVRGFLRGVARRPELGRDAQDLLDEAAVITCVLDEKEAP